MKDLPLILDFATVLACIVALVVYRLFRRFNQEPFKGFLGWLDRNLVEVILAGIAVPDFFTYFEKLTGG